MWMSKQFYLGIERALATLTSKIVCISDAERESAINYHITRSDRLAFIPSGIDIEAVRQAEPIRRSDLGIKDDDYVIGAIGRLVSQKAPEIFVEAAKLIKKEIGNAVFIFVGGGAETDAIRKMAEDYQIKLLLPGWVDNPYSYLKIFDMALSLPRWEGFGLAITEYMAAEKNIVATRVDAIPTLIEDGKEGLLVDVDSPEDVKDKVLYIYNHPNEAAKMRKNALEKVMRDYDIKRVAEQHRLLFNSLVEK
jgi:glycosyltransferase involved in cell wall biosynthesis